MTRPLLAFADGREDGAESPDGRVRGCYVHGLFGNDAQRRAWLAWIGAPSSALAYEAQVEATLDRLAEHLERHVRVDALLAMADLRPAGITNIQPLRNETAMACGAQSNRPRGD